MQLRYLSLFIVIYLLSIVLGRFGVAPFISCRWYLVYLMDNDELSLVTVCYSILLLRFGTNTSNVSVGDKVA